MPDPAELDVDARFLLANERTLLAWERTALALVAGGVAIEHFGSGVAAHGLLAVAVVAVGVATAVTGGVRFRRADRALRTGTLPATGTAGYALAGAVAVLGAVLAVALLVG